MYKIDKHLTKGSLGDILRAWAGDDNVKQQVPIIGTRFKNDYEVVKNGITYVVELYGSNHYRDPNVISIDVTKEKLSSDLGKKVVRVPYFIQLNTETFKALFDDDFEIETTYPHGFVATKYLPASFCPVGYGRACDELEKFSPMVRNDVMFSLSEKAEKLGNVFVYFKNHIAIVNEEDGGIDEISWDRFLKMSNEIHNFEYDYIHPL